MKAIPVIFLIIFFSTLSCSKKGGSGGNDNLPSNLTVTATVNPDNSGNVSFTATATNAVVYIFDFGDGNSQTVTTGTATHKYTSTAKYGVNVTAKSSSGQSVSKSILVDVTYVPSLVWSDEFGTDGLPDATKWGYDTGAGGWGNNELEYYTTRSDNASVSGGTLKITAKAESYSGSAYTSARLLSKGKFSFKYGKIEVRAKLPAGVGTWPAIWMLGDNISTAGWPACGEADIMEHVGSQLNKIFGTLHYPGHSGANGSGGTTIISNATTEFHRYAMDWSASVIKFSVDDAVFFTFTNDSSLPFNQNFFIILNVAMGGNFGGTVDPAFTSASMEIDYVRVYQ
jgi:beta-glucanase (GH16 family)